MTEYLEVTVEISPFEPWSDILCHELGNLGFESFELAEPVVKAYIPNDDFQKDSFEALLTSLDEDVKTSYSTQLIAPTNWNKEWESNFHPSVIAEQIYVRAPFHDPAPQYPFELIIHPKMAFGTGHHATTNMILEALLGLDLKGKTVMDVGTGTGILAIMAEKLGATDILAFDNDDWSVLNAGENLELNSCERITVEKQVVEHVDRKPVNVILANINKNVILADLGYYAELLLPEGHLFLSGFMTDDINHILEVAKPRELSEADRKQTGEWAMLHLVKVEA